MVCLLLVYRKAGQDVGRRDPGSVGGEVSVDGILFKEVTSGQGVLVVQDVIPVAHTLMIVEFGGIGEAGAWVLAGSRQSGASVVHRVCTRHYVLAVGELELHEPESDRIDVRSIGCNLYRSTLEGFILLDTLTVISQASPLRNNGTQCLSKSLCCRVALRFLHGR